MDEKMNKFIRKVCPFCGKEVKIYSVRICPGRNEIANELLERTVDKHAYISHEESDEPCFLNDLVFNHKIYVIYDKDRIVCKLWNKRPRQL